MTQQELEHERLEYQREYGHEDGDALFAQEYMCSWDAAIVGSCYGKLMRDAQADGRITSVSYEPMVSFRPTEACGRRWRP
jgi:phage terminase large subunit